MKKLIVAAIITAAAVTATHAQDPIKVGGGMYTVKLEEKGVRVMEVTFKPGESIAQHSHPDHVVYALKGGTIEITEQGKEPEKTEVKDGDTMYFPAQTHKARNVGDTELKFLVVELPKK